MTAALWLIGYYKKPNGLKLGFGYAIYASTALNNLIDKIAEASKRAWKVWFTSGWFVFGIATAVAIYILGGDLLKELSSIAPVATVMPVVPGLTIPLAPGLLALAVTVIVHELSHAIAARSGGVKVKRLGIIFILALPIGAFTEPDETSFNEAPHKTKLRILAAGSLANFATAALAVGLLSVFLLGYPSTPSAVVVQGIIPHTLASSLGLKGGYLIYAINNTRTNTLTALSSALASSRPGQLVTLVTNHGNLTGRLGAVPPGYGDSDKGFIGIYLNSMPFFAPRLYLGLSVPAWLQIEVYGFWIWFINLNVGIFNALPIPMLDGDQFFKELVAMLKEKGLSLTIGNGVVYGLEAISIGLLFANLIFSLSVLLRNANNLRRVRKTSRILRQ